MQLLDSKDEHITFEGVLAGLLEIYPTPDWVLQQWLESTSQESLILFIYIIQDNEFGIQRRNTIDFLVTYGRETAHLPVHFLDWARTKMALKVKQIAENTEEEALFDQLTHVLKILEE